jgi:ADP-ribose pyrophosphatase YjhB (NUDIX family)
MYVVFVNNKPIYLSDQICADKNYEFYNFTEIQIEEVLYKLKNTDCLGFCLYHSDIQQMWSAFKENFEVVQAAGGLVIKNKKILLIYRNNNWDLPKGKVEEGESFQTTALREVEEECGVKDLKITSELAITNHLFYENKKYKLKMTHWFSMHTNSDKEPTPQQEEGITKAVFTAVESIPKLYETMYKNISQLLINYFKTESV